MKMYGRSRPTENCCLIFDFVVRQEKKRKRKTPLSSEKFLEEGGVFVGIPLVLDAVQATFCCMTNIENA